jgi:broad specificity phosphatase PhoE
VSARRIFLVRHGETAFNAARILQTPEVPLSPRGEAQAAALGARLAGRGITLVLASDFARAVGTAERLCAATGAPLALDPLLQERSFGALRGTPWAALGFDPFAADYAPPEGETWAAFHARVELAWAKVRAAAERTPGSLAVVTHGLVCASLAMHHLRLPPGAEARRGFANTSLTEIEAAPPWTVAVLDCIAHLAADPDLVSERERARRAQS